GIDGDSRRADQPVGGGRTGYSSSSSARASQVANRSTGTSNSGLRSTKVCSRCASQARLTSSSPRRSVSSSMPRSVKYIRLFPLLAGVPDAQAGPDLVQLLHDRDGLG